MKSSGGRRQSRLAGATELSVKHMLCASSVQAQHPTYMLATMLLIAGPLQYQSMLLGAYLRDPDT